MKKLLSLLLALLMAATLTCALADAPTEYASGDYKYTLQSDGTAKITKYTGRDQELIIPATLAGRKVTAIGASAFAFHKSLTSVTISEGIIIIEDGAFILCDSLRIVTLPGSVTSIGRYAFMSCTSLVTFFIPDTVTSIGINPFIDCSKLTYISVSGDHPTLASIDGVLFEKSTKSLISCPGAFAGNSYTIPQGIRCIGASAFYGCRDLTTITIPDSVTSIEDHAFHSCNALTSITLPESITTIGKSAFSFCGALTSITIPDSVTHIGADAFRDCSALTAITVGRNSFAAQYCKDNGLPYTYTDVSDWLLN